MNQFKRFIRCFGYAIWGVLHCVRDERNFRFHLTAMGYGLALAWYVQLSRLEYAILFLTFGSVLAMEAMNTAVEAAVDLSCPKGQVHPLAKLAKDAAAGAVLIHAFFSMVVGICLFYRPDKLSLLFAQLAKPLPLILWLVSLVMAAAFVFLPGKNSPKKER